MIARLLKPIVLEKIGQGKAIIIIGPRQVGKSTLLAEIARESGKKVLFLDCDEHDDRQLLIDATSTALRASIGGAELVLIDEAQRVKNIGLTLKLFTDKIREVQVLVTGSSSFDLANEINEPLTGRKFEYMMFPLSTLEMIRHHGEKDERRLLLRRLLYGFYPEVLNAPGNAPQALRDISKSYLFKDLFAFREIRKPELLEKLLRALALQMGNEVSFNELANTIGSDQLTVQRYLDLLEKSFVIFRLSAFSRNLRTELKRSRKIYFYDNGIRNALLNNFLPIDSRQDIGALWENFLVAERMKYLHYAGKFPNTYFWRTQLGDEIDYLEEQDGQIHAFEFKWNPSRSAKMPTAYAKTYPNSTFTVINPENYLGFVAPESA
ncbi:MAG: ATP-binding protein [Saprospirales bacterium]|nr:ATP-binding protein [Saprospirales bacterium]